MPGYRAHLAGGMCVYIALMVLCALHPSWYIAFEWLAFTLLGALFPDVDTKSKGQKIFYQIILLIYAVLLWQQRMTLFVLVSFIGALPLIVHHRGLFHRFWFIGFFSFALAFGVSQCMPAAGYAICYDMLFFACGAWSHILLDGGWRKIFRF